MVRYIRPQETLTLRSRVLRGGKPHDQCIFPSDELGFHLGNFIDEKLVCIATFVPEDYAEKGSGGYRLRGMATDPVFVGRGLGKATIKFAMDELIAANASYIWCSARHGAVGFYQGLGFEIISEQFEIPEIGLHYDMLYNLK